jgi:hypothetical protein
MNEGKWGFQRPPWWEPPPNAPPFAAPVGGGETAPGMNDDGDEKNFARFGAKFFEMTAPDPSSNGV